MLKLALRDVTRCFNVQRDSNADYGFAHDGKHGMLCAQKTIITHPICIHKNNFTEYFQFCQYFHKGSRHAT